MTEHGPRLSVLAFVALALVAFMALTFAVGYLVGKLLL